MGHARLVGQGFSPADVLGPVSWVAGASGVEGAVRSEGPQVLLETAFSIGMLGTFIWAMRVMIPKAVRAHDRLAIACAALTALVALLAWLLVGIRVR